MSPATQLGPDRARPESGSARGTGRIGAAKVMSLASSYWHGDENSDRLTRVYGTAFFSKKDLDKHLHALEEAKKRDHRVLGKQLELFHIDDAVGQGLILWTPRGAIVRVWTMFDGLRVHGAFMERLLVHKWNECEHRAKEEAGCAKWAETFPENTAYNAVQARSNWMMTEDAKAEAALWERRERSGLARSRREAALNQLGGAASGRGRARRCSRAARSA